MRAVFIDIETSGLDPYLHQPIEIACVIVDLYTGKREASYQTSICLSYEKWLQADQKSVLFNGFTFEELLLGREVSVVKADLKELFQKYSIIHRKAVFIGQNSSFDRPFFSQIISVQEQEVLQLPYHWLDFASMYWAIFVQQKKNICDQVVSFSKDAIAAAYALPKEEMPHRAMNGVAHLLLCYEKCVGFPGFRDRHFNSEV